MAIFDREINKLVAKIVYDGTIMAGKTTNLRQLCNFFTSMRRSELYVPGELNDRTLFFDWLQLDGGLVCGYGLRCQLISVPGQLVLAKRRAHLLSTADAIVFVCDSTRLGINEAKKRFERLMDYIKFRELSESSLVVQANKQDMPGALSLAEIARELSIPPNVTIIPARASDGIGVRETAVIAIRSVANTIQQKILDYGIDSLEGSTLNGQQLYLEMISLESPSPDWSIETLIDQDVLVPTATEEYEEPASGDSTLEETPPSPDTVASHALMDEEIQYSEGEVIDRAIFGEYDDISQERESESNEENPLQLDIFSTGDGDQENEISIETENTHLFTENEDEPEEEVSSPSIVAGGEALPVAASATDVIEEPSPSLSIESSNPDIDVPMPSADVMTGFIWPATTGRDVVRRLPISNAIFRDDLIAQQGSRNGSGSSDMIIYKAGDWCLKTSRRRRYKDVDEGRDALIQLARSKITLGNLLIADTVLILQQDLEKHYWLWTIAPWASTLRAHMAEADAAGDEESLGLALERFAIVAVQAMLLAASSGVALDINPSNFGIHQDRTLYLDDDISSGSSIPAIGYALIQRVDEYAHHEAAINRYMETLQREISRRINGDKAKSLDLERAIEQTAARSAEAQDARKRLSSLVARCANQM